MKRELSATGEDPLDADWQGNNAAFTCPVCGKVFLISGIIHKKGRDCPKCQKSHGFVRGGRAKDGAAFIEWSGDEAPEVEVRDDAPFGQH